MIEFLCNCGQANRIPEDKILFLSSIECIKCGNVTQINHKYLEGPSLALTLNDNCEIVKAEEFMVDTDSESIWRKDD